MTDQIQGVAGSVGSGTTSTAGAATGTPLGSIGGALQGSLNNILNMGHSYLDRFFPPAQREDVKQKLTTFATERPKLTSFLLSQIALSGPALALFLIMALTVFIFALLAGIIVGLIGALLFVVFCLGVALFVLLPTLFFTTFSAVAIWLFGLGAYYIIKWFNEKNVPGIHVPFTEGVLEQTGLKDLPVLSGKPAQQQQHQKQQHQEHQQQRRKQQKGEENTKTDTNGNRSDKHVNGQHKSTSADTVKGDQTHSRKTGAVGQEHRSQKTYHQQHQNIPDDESAQGQVQKSVSDVTDAVGGVGNTKGVIASGQ